MKYFLYTVEDEEIKEAKGEVKDIPEGFIKCKNTFAIEDIFYKIQDTKVTEVIGEAYHEDTAKRRVDDFLSALNVNLF